MAKKKAKSDRIFQLLAICAESLENCGDPMGHDFFQKYDVTSDECYTLCQQMSVAIKAYIRTPTMERVDMIARAVIDDEQTREFAVTSMKHQRATKRVVEALGRLNDAGKR